MIMKRLFAFVLLGMICLTACGSKGGADLPADSKGEAETQADSKAETALPVYYGGGSNTADRMLPASYSDLVNHSDAVVIAEPVAEKEQFINKSYDANLGRMLASSGYTVVAYKVDQVIMGDVKEGDTLDIREYHYNWVRYEEDGTTTDCIISFSNLKPSVIGEKYLLYLTKRQIDETWDFTFDEFTMYTYDDKKVGPWLREDMDQESYDYKLYQRIFREVTEQMTESDDTTKTSTSDTKSVQNESTDREKTSSSRMNTESQNTVSTTNGSVETTVIPNSTTTESYEQRMKAEYDAVVENAISDQPYNDVLKSTVSDDIILRYLDYTMNPWMSHSETPVSMNNRYKIELIRTIDDQRIYSIQKPESGGLFYSFYVNSGLECTAYITKSLYFADYNAIKVGSSIDDVIAIEPATQAYIKRNRTYDNLSNDGETAGAFKQHIILKDGLLKLTYSRSGDTYKVSQIDFFDDFKESIDWGMGYPCVYDYSILPNDYPS